MLCYLVMKRNCFKGLDVCCVYVYISHHWQICSWIVFLSNIVSSYILKFIHTAFLRWERIVHVGCSLQQWHIYIKYQIGFLAQKWSIKNSLTHNTSVICYKNNTMYIVLITYMLFDYSFSSFCALKKGEEHLL